MARDPSSNSNRRRLSHVFVFASYGVPHVGGQGRAHVTRSSTHVFDPEHLPRSLVRGHGMKNDVPPPT